MKAIKGPLPFVEESTSKFRCDTNNGEFRNKASSPACASYSLFLLFTHSTN